MAISSGTVTGNYIIEAAIAQGGMAMIYRARHRILESTHAIKVLNDNLARSEEMRKRFLSEGKIQACYRHPHITPVTDVIAEPGIAGLVMPFLEGSDLGGRLEGGRRIGLPQAIQWTRQVLSALAYVHGRGIVHRDLKPGNMFLEEIPDEEPRIRLMDFGIAKVVDQPQSWTRTRAGVMGTPSYMSPEQVRSPADVDARSDLFVLGAVLYEMLTGKMAFSGESAFDTQTLIVQGQLTPIRKLLPDIPPALIGVIHKALSTDRDDRFATAREFSAALQLAMQQPDEIALPRLSPAPSPPRESRAAPPPRPAPRTPRAAPLRPAAPVSRTIRGQVLELLPIPAGVFTLGAGPTAHTVTLTRPFLLARHPVIQPLWRAVTGEDVGTFDGYGLPVEGVSWFDAVLFCNHLSRLERLKPAYDIGPGREPEVRWDRDAPGYRLPTEAEWEYAARADSHTAFAGGDEAERVGWFIENSGEKTHRVGMKLPNAWGLHDMSGNVHEWVWDRGGPYPDGSQVDPDGPRQGVSRVLRGGSWQSIADSAHITERIAELPARTRPDLGFRLARNTE